MSHSPITTRDPHDLPPDSLHMMINNATNLKTCLEISVGNEGKPSNAKWSRSKVEELRHVARGIVDSHLNKLTGYVPKVGQISGPQLRRYLADDVKDQIISIIPEGEMKEAYTKAHDNYLDVDKISRRLHPTQEDKDSFEAKARRFSEAYTDIGWAEPNNQMHAVTEHTSYYLQLEGVNSLGKLSTEGNEAGNRRFKTEKKLHTFRGSVHEQMSQIVRFEWLTSSSVLQRSLTSKERKKTVCSKCHQDGHIRSSKLCPMFAC